MKQDHKQGHSEHKKTEPVEPHVLICANDVGIIDHDAICKSTFSCFRALELVECMHEHGIFRMAFGTVFNRIGFRQDFMCNKYGIINFCMALNTPDTPEMCCLVGQPVVAFNYHNFFPVGKKGEAVKICMTSQAHIVVIQDRFFNILGIPHKSLVTMGVMAFPAGELIHIVNAFLELYLNILKMVLGEGLIVAMAIHAHKLLLYSCFDRVRKSGVIVGMTIVTGKGPVDR